MNSSESWPAVKTKCSQSDPKPACGSNLVKSCNLTVCRVLHQCKICKHCYLVVGKSAKDLAIVKIGEFETSTVFDKVIVGDTSVWRSSCFKYYKKRPMARELLFLINCALFSWNPYLLILSKCFSLHRILFRNSELSIGPRVPPNSLGRSSGGIILWSDFKLLPWKWIWKKKRNYINIFSHKQAPENSNIFTKMKHLYWIKALFFVYFWLWFIQQYNISEQAGEKVCVFEATLNFLQWKFIQSYFGGKCRLAPLLGKIWFRYFQNLAITVIYKTRIPPIVLK